MLNHLLLLLLLEQVMLLGDLHLGVLLLLLLLEDELLLLAVHGNRFADDHSAGRRVAAATLGEPAAEVFLLAELLLLLERAELGRGHGLAVAELDDAGRVVELLLGGWLLDLLLLRGWWWGGLLGDCLLVHLGRLLHRLRGRRLVGLLIQLLLLLLLGGGARLGGRRRRFGDDRRLDAVLEVFEIVRVAGGFLGRGGGGRGSDLFNRHLLLLLLGWLRLRLRRLGNRGQLRWLSAGRSG